VKTLFVLIVYMVGGNAPVLPDAPFAYQSTRDCELARNTAEAEFAKDPYRFGTRALCVKTTVWDK